MPLRAHMQTIPVRQLGGRGTPEVYNCLKFLVIGPAKVKKWDDFLGPVKARNQRAPAQTLGHDGAQDRPAEGSKRLPELDGSLPQKLQEMQDWVLDVLVVWIWLLDLILRFGMKYGTL